MSTNTSIHNVRPRKCRTCKLIKSILAFSPIGDGARSRVCTTCQHPTEKRCPVCKEVKPIAAFGVSLDRGDRHASTCLACLAARRARLRGVRRPRNERARSWEIAEGRLASLRAQKRDPQADYFASYRGVACPLIWGGVLGPARSIARFAEDLGEKPPPGVELSIEFADGAARPRSVA